MTATLFMAFFFLISNVFVFADASSQTGMEDGSLLDEFSYVSEGTEDDTFLIGDSFIDNGEISFEDLSLDTAIKLNSDEIYNPAEKISPREFMAEISLNEALEETPEGGFEMPLVEIPSIVKRPLEEFSADSLQPIDFFQFADSSQSILSAAAAAATPSLTITSKTSTSVTFNVVYPSSGVNGNVFMLFDFNQGASILPSAPYGGNYYRTNGTYTISGLIPGGMYQVVMCWSTDNGANYGGVNTIFRRAQLPYNTTETLTTNYGSYVFSSIETADKAFASTANFTTWLARMDYAYTTLKTLTGNTPYNGSRIELRSTREDMNTYSPDGQYYWYLTWAYAGNPTKIAEFLYKSLMKRLASGDWGDAPIHEISHDFDKDVWTFDPEVLADFKEYYVVEQLAAKVYRPDTNKYYTGSDFYNFFKTDQWESYDNTFANGYYHPRGLTAILIRIKNSLGTWLPFQKTFAYMGSIPANQQPTTDLEKFNLFITKLRDFSGIDVLAKLTASEKSILAGWFGGTIRYMTRAIVVIPGVMGSRLNRSNGTKVWEPIWTEVFLSTTFSNTMKPYLYCNTDGSAQYTLTPVNDGKGADDACETLINSLKNEFISKNYSIIFFPYDWRLDNAANASKLETALSSYDEVYIAAHSMGGLVASSYIRKSTANRKKVKELITMGTPFLGSTKIINTFETGEVFDSLMTDGLMSGHIKELIANYYSAYQLIPTSRYPNTIIKFTSTNTTNYTYSQSMSFLGERSWARSTNGVAKPLLNGAAAFHSGLMSSSVHVSDTVPHYYISGRNIDTRATAVYVTDTLGGKTISHFDLVSGDGTVILSSSENINAASYYRVSNAEHSELPKNASIIQKVKSILNDDFNSFRTNVSMSSTNSNIDSLAIEDKRIMVILEGSDEVNIEDEFGNIIFERGEGLYVLDALGVEKRIGSVWMINHETNRKQYNLNSDEYSISVSNPGKEGSASDALVIYTEAGEYKSYEAYNDLTGIDAAQISITPNTTEVFINSAANDNVSYRKNIAPSTVWEYDRLEEYNSELSDS